MPPVGHGATSNLTLGTNFTCISASDKTSGPWDEVKNAAGEPLQRNRKEVRIVVTEEHNMVSGAALPDIDDTNNGFVLDDIDHRTNNKGHETLAVTASKRVAVDHEHTI